MSPAADARQLVDKLWNYCHVLRHDGVSTIDYVDQLTLLLFLKMAQERADRPAKFAEKIVPDGYDWNSFANLSGEDLVKQYNNILAELGKMDGAIGRIFQKSQNKIRDPQTLSRLVKDLIGQQNWSRTGVDIKGDAYEALLEKGAEDVKSGAGQYFTPRALIAAMVDCVQPTPDDTLIDPACGTGGFLLAAHDHMTEQHPTLNPKQRDHINNGGIQGIELVDSTARLAQMNLLLHGIGKATGDEKISVDDALAKPPAERASVVLANPPFGRKTGYSTVDADGKVVREDISYDRQDFWVTTSNKQLNFVQHIVQMLDPEPHRTSDGERIVSRAAVVVPDNVLFEGGAGETIRQRLLKECDVHTLLRLPTGIFYAGGVKANVLFFDRKPPMEGQHHWTRKLWVYDFRTNEHFTLKQHKLTREDLQPFVDAYMPSKDRAERVESERFKAFTYDELVARDKTNLDISWMREESEDDGELLPPDVIAQEIVDDLQAALSEFAAVAETLQAANDDVEDVDE